MSTGTKTCPSETAVANTAIRYGYICQLVGGSYTWKVRATDRAGNPQSIIGQKTLVE